MNRANNRAALPSKIIESLGNPQATVFIGAAMQWDTPNSLVLSVPALATAELQSICDPNNLSTSLVRVSGPTTEPLHFHTSNIVGVAVRGEGTFYCATVDGEECTQRVTAGDIVVIPRGALHVFTTESGGLLEYVALEFSAGKIDYQAHLVA